MYAAVPSTTIDWTLPDGTGIPIEERDANELLLPGGRHIDRATRYRSGQPGVRRDAPARLFTGLITERGICRPDHLRTLFPVAVERINR
jgi:methylthioribose-1-phosphate isomerase